MQALRNLLNRSPLWIRVAPFLIFCVLTSLQGKLGAESYYWMYAAKTVVGVFLVWAMWPIVAEMRWAFSWEAALVGIAVFVFWVGLDSAYPKWGKIEHIWNPRQDLGGAGALAAWGYVILRVLGSGLVVPPLEEVFYRSFVYRYIINPDFEKIPLGAYNLAALLVTSVIFGAAHFEWLPGILCGLAYQGLVIKKKRLGDAMTAHAITNILLGIYVAWKGAWHFW